MRLTITGLGICLRKCELCRMDWFKSGTARFCYGVLVKEILGCDSEMGQYNQGVWSAWDW